MSAVSDQRGLVAVPPRKASESPLIEELEHVRLTGASKLDDPGPNLDLLVTHATRLFPLVATKGQSALVGSLLKEAISSPYIRGLYSDSKQTGLRAMFGVTGTRITDTNSFEEREKEAAKHFGVARHTFRNPGKRAERLGHIARAIELLVEQKARDEGSSDLVVSPSPTPYVRRSQLEQKFAALLDDHAPIIVLAGPPSVGKRTLARYLTNEYKSANAQVLRVDGSNPQAIQQSIYDELAKAGVGTHEISIVPQYQLREFMQSDGAPRYVIIENACDSALARFLAEAKTETTVVVLMGNCLNRHRGV